MLDIDDATFPNRDVNGLVPNIDVLEARELLINADGVVVPPTPDAILGEPTEFRADGKADEFSSNRSSTRQ